MTGVKVLTYMAVGLAAFIAGGVLGVWIGSITEQDAIVTIVTQAELTPECRAQFDGAIKRIIRDYESGQPSAGP